MKRFAALMAALGDTVSINRKVDELVSYFSSTSGSDRDWAIFILAGGKLKRQVNSTQLRQWAGELASLPAWLVEESYHVVGDLAETIALITPTQHESSDQSLTSWIENLQQIAALDDNAKKELIFRAWRTLSTNERFVFNKLITGALRIGVQKSLLIKALARFSSLPEPTIAQRLSGNLEPRRVSFDSLVAEDNAGEPSLNPYPFYLAYALDDELKTLGEPDEWHAEWKWDGIRGQIVVRNEGYAVWSRGEDLITDRFPEFASFAAALPPGTVLDGEILAWSERLPLSFSLLQTRIGRKKLTPRILESTPVIFQAYDLLEYRGEDHRSKPFEYRRSILDRVVAELDVTQLGLSTLLPFASWEDLTILREDARIYRAEGLMLKRRSSPYLSGRKRGDWWKWKVDPRTVDGVLVYAQRGHGRRADLYTDYTFAVWNDGALVPFAKAYSGLTDRELQQVDSFIRSHTREKFGPVRTVEPELVFEIAFEGIQQSPRHKSGIAVRFPRINRWRHDKPASEADSLDTLKAMLESEEGRA